MYGKQDAMTGLFHSDIGLPEQILAPFLGKDWGLEYSRHAASEGLRDKRGPLSETPHCVNFARGQVFEVEVERDTLIKLCVRLDSGFETQDGLGVRYHLVLVLSPSPRRPKTCLTVRTLWLTDADDDHATLDLSKYTRL